MGDLGLRSRPILAPRHPPAVGVESQLCRRVPELPLNDVDRSAAPEHPHGPMMPRVLQGIRRELEVPHCFPMPVADSKPGQPLTPEAGHREVVLGVCPEDRPRPFGHASHWAFVVSSCGRMDGRMNARFPALPAPSSGECERGHEECPLLYRIMRNGASPYPLLSPCRTTRGAPPKSPCATDYSARLSAKARWACRYLIVEMQRCSDHATGRVLQELP
jgi:hypothetical protein